jgi:hypothetical protein
LFRVAKLEENVTDRGISWGVGVAFVVVVEEVVERGTLSERRSERSRVDKGVG